MKEGLVTLHEKLFRKGPGPHLMDFYTEFSQQSSLGYGFQGPITFEQVVGLIVAASHLVAQKDVDVLVFVPSTKHRDTVMQHIQTCVDVLKKVYPSGSEVMLALQHTASRMGVTTKVSLLVDPPTRWIALGYDYEDNLPSWMLGKLL